MELAAALLIGAGLLLLAIVLLGSDPVEEDGPPTLDTRNHLDD